jgi:hypothetical protein
MNLPRLPAAGARRAQLGAGIDRTEPLVETPGAAVLTDDPEPRRGGSMG